MRKYYASYNDKIKVTFSLSLVAMNQKVMEDKTHMTANAIHVCFVNSVTYESQL